MKKLLVVFIISMLSVIYSLDTQFTNLFEDTYEKKLETDEKKRSTYSVMNSGNKIGMLIGYNYVINDIPYMFGALTVDIPFSKISSVSFNVGFQDVQISSNITYTITNVDYQIELAGEVKYLNVTGVLKFYFGSWCFGGGLSYYRFLTGYSYYTEPLLSMTIMSRLDTIDHDFYLLGNIGFLSEIRENVFLLPEVGFYYRLPPGSQRMLISITAGLLFKL